ncbi:DUF192 domain-containing protein [Candidatus Woesearchaeota archaeon]|nr:DUF192 domain-containing protein [Candidatus Woesearchaeota archaeon]
MKQNFVKIFAKKMVIFLIFFILIFLTNCTKNFEIKETGNYKQIFINNGEKTIKINAEIADDNEERMNGLMFRKNLDENEGMLFVFDNEEVQIFWMKNTLIPLDMIFINENLEIVGIKHAVPCEKEPCGIYQSEKPAKYVLEVNGNFTIKNKIKIGDRINIS